MRSEVSSSLALDNEGYGIKSFARRQAGRAAGLALFAAVAFGLAALGTWNVADPSFSYATDNPVTNAMGYPGAVFSDLFMQFFGLAAVGLFVPAVAWSFFLATARGVDSMPKRGIAWFLMGVLGAGIAGCITPPPTWPLPTGLGGVFGDIVLKLPSMFLGGYPTGVAAWAIAIVLAGPVLFLFAYASGLVWRRNGFARQDAKSERQQREEDLATLDEGEEDDRERFVALGVITHWWLSARAWMHRRAVRRREREEQEFGLPAKRESAWRQAAERVESAERDEARIETRVTEAGRARVEPEFFAAIVADHRVADHRAVAPHEPAYHAAYDTPNSASAFEEDEDDAVDVPPVFVEPRRSPIGPNTRVQNFRSPSRSSQMTEWSSLEPQLMPAEPEAPTPPAFEPDFDEPVFETAPPAAPVHTASPVPQPSARVATPAPRPAPAARVLREPAAPLVGANGFEMPSLQFLSEPKNVARDPSLSQEALEANARRLEGVLEDFGVKGEIIHVRPGPVVTLYELEPAPGIKSSRVIGLADDIARSMSAIAARVAVVPGRNAIGIELPNVRRETVYLREILASKDFENTKAKLALALGKTINGEAVIVDIAKMPHVLVAGTTGSGKSVAINTMILSLLYRMTPEQCRLIMIDPKMLELSVYDGIPHLLTPVVTDPKKAVVALKWTVREMEDRYRKMAKVGVRNIDGFNARVLQAEKSGEKITRTVQTGFDRQTGEAVYESEDLDLAPLPYIVVIIDEMADLMMVAGKDIEGAVQRLAQMARAAGIHVIMATQRPSVDVITGTIKANFPTRMSFQVTSKIDSRTILGEQGAEQLLGMGDMLYMAGGGRIQRVHGPFVADEEVEKIVGHLKLQGVPEYLDAITEDDEEDDDEPSGKGGSGGGGSGNFEDSDDPYDQAVAVVLRDGKASTSYIQRRLGIGYNRAASIIERMEQEGIVGAANHAGKREILVPTEDDKM
ncbi:DNA translocase FtsK [Oryzicola mucosus]|uniref:DNA translocase FtsK n=1 Tax=Oryzicola mucosus TaxID=2767425 RepID=UPI001E3212CC|nr:DNA translocase FtsK [Oryzicola mucosus]